MTESDIYKIMFDYGKKSYLLGLKRTENPHPYPSEEHRGWQDGWMYQKYTNGIN